MCTAAVKGTSTAHNFGDTSEKKKTFVRTCIQESQENTFELGISNILIGILSLASGWHAETVTLSVDGKCNMLIQSLTEIKNVCHASLCAASKEGSTFFHHIIYCLRCQWQEAIRYQGSLVISRIISKIEPATPDTPRWHPRPQCDTSHRDNRRLEQEGQVWRCIKSWADKPCLGKYFQNQEQIFQNGKCWKWKFLCWLAERCLACEVTISSLQPPEQEDEHWLNLVEKAPVSQIYVLMIRCGPLCCDNWRSHWKIRCIIDVVEEATAQSNEDVSSEAAERQVNQTQISNRLSTERNGW